MGYQSVGYVPRITSYAQAERLLKTTAPIRGRSPKIIPLGRRKDCDIYHICEGRGDDIQLVLYSTAVLTVHNDDSMTVHTNGYNTQSTHQFIHQVTGIQANGFRGTTKLTFADGYVHLLANNETIRIRRNENGRWVADDKRKLRGYKMNRKAANNVRARYVEFSNYLRGIVSLRKEQLDSPVWVHNGYTDEIISIDHTELATAFEGTPLIDGRGHDMYTGLRYVTATLPNGTSHREMLMQWIDPSQSEETKTDNYYKAFLALSMHSRHAVFLNASLHTHSRVQAGEAFFAYDKALMMANAREVLIEVELDYGKSPNPKYVDWIKE